MSVLWLIALTQGLAEEAQTPFSALKVDSMDGFG
jgi:hypothetical protein